MRYPPCLLLAILSAASPAWAGIEIIDNIIAADKDAQVLRDEAHLHLACSKKVDDANVSFIAHAHDKILVTTFTKRPLADAAKNIWLTMRPAPGTVA